MATQDSLANKLDIRVMFSGDGEASIHAYGSLEEKSYDLLKGVFGLVQTIYPDKVKPSFVTESEETI